MVSCAVRGGERTYNAWRDSTVFCVPISMKDFTMWNALWNGSACGWRNMYHPAHWSKKTSSVASGWVSPSLSFRPLVDIWLKKVLKMTAQNELSFCEQTELNRLTRSDVECSRRGADGHGVSRLEGSSEG